MALNPSRQAAGLYDDDVFGGMNRQPIQGDSPHPYGSGEGTGTCATNPNVIADVTQKAAASGLVVDARARFHYVDTNAADAWASLARRGQLQLPRGPDRRGPPRGVRRELADAAGRPLAVAAAIAVCRKHCSGASKAACPGAAMAAFIGCVALQG